MFAGLKGKGGDEGPKGMKGCCILHYLSNIQQCILLR